MPYADVGIRHDVVVIGELFMADRTYATLMSDLAVQQFPHLGLVIAILCILPDDRDLRSSEFLVELALDWAGVRGHSKKAICELGIVHSCEVSWHSSDLHVQRKRKREVADNP